MKQTEIWTVDDYSGIQEWISDKGIHRLFLVGGRALSKMAKLNCVIEETGIKVIYFKEYQSNPLYSSVVDGVRSFRNQNCDGIMAVGGGSAIDVAKCVKLYSNMPGDGINGEFLKQEIEPNKVPFLVIPTTAGTGSEATRYAVVYHKGEKQSVCHESCIPEHVLFSVEAVKNLSEYHKKAAMLDALSHALESFWSVNSTEESRDYSRQALQAILENKEEYMKNTDAGISGMLRASNLAGKAINISQTTAGHAMCYKLTSLTGYAHGHAAFLCNMVIFKDLIESNRQCIDKRGAAHLKEVLEDISAVMGCKTLAETANRLEIIFNETGLEVPELTEEQIMGLAASVNAVRLKNHPVKLDAKQMEELYRRIGKLRTRFV